MNYLMLNNKKINLTDEQVKEIQKSFDFGNTKLSDVNVGDTFKIGDYEFIVLEHGKETTAVIMKNLLETSLKFGENNNFADKNCIVKARLSNFATKLEKIVGVNNLVRHTVDLTSDDGLKDYGKIQSKVSLLTCNQYRRYVDILDKHKVDKWWWLCTAHSTPTHEDKDWVKCVSPAGNVNYSYYDDNNGVRPFCILNSNIFVSK